MILLPVLLGFTEPLNLLCTYHCDHILEHVSTEVYGQWGLFPLRREVGSAGDCPVRGDRQDFDDGPCQRQKFTVAWS